MCGHCSSRPIWHQHLLLPLHWLHAVRCAGTLGAVANIFVIERVYMKLQRLFRAHASPFFTPSFLFYVFLQTSNNVFSRLLGLPRPCAAVRCTLMRLRAATCSLRSTICTQLNAKTFCPAYCSSIIKIPPMILLLPLVVIN